MTVCEFKDCTKNAYFNIAAEKNGRFCSTHKEDGMINVKDKRCLHEGCCQRPSFNILGQKPMYCGTHKNPEMVNVMTKFCEHAGCLVTPVYNTPDKKTGRFCATHKEPTMINVVNNMCEEEGCNNSPSFGIVGSRPTHCGTHKTAEMMNVKHKKCTVDGCDKLPSYAIPTEKAATHCSIHKTEDMMNVKHKKCEHDGCVLIASYGILNEKNARFCKNHKLKEMVDVTHKKCEADECLRRPIYNFAVETKPKFCSDHKSPGMIDLSNKKCISEWCVNRSTNKYYEGYCLHCFVHLFPEKPTVRNYKTKEQSVVEFVKTAFPDTTWVCDKRVADGCSRRRPDMLMDLGYQVIIIEVDENQHMDYDTTYENRRLMEISQDHNHRPIVFIRFNPDDYIKRDGSRVKSCWSVSKTTGNVAVDKNNKRPWNERLIALHNQIIHWRNHKSDRVVEVVQLFFDDYE
jgi:hypothetical protein